MSNTVKNMNVKKKKHIGQNLDQKFTLEDRISMRQRDCGWSTHIRYSNYWWLVVGGYNQSLGESKA